MTHSAPFSQPNDLDAYWMPYMFKRRPPLLAGAKDMHYVDTSGRHMSGPDNAVELFHGYTYSAHPLACAAARDTLDLYSDEGLFQRTRAQEAEWARAIHALRDAPHVVDIRTLGLTAAVELEPRPGQAGARGYAAVEHAFFALDVVLRQAGDTIVLTPPLIAGSEDIAKLAKIVGQAIAFVD